MSSTRHFATIVLDGSGVLTRRTIEVPFASATLEELMQWIQIELVRQMNPMEHYRSLFDFHNACMYSQHLELTFSSSEDGKDWHQALADQAQALRPHVESPTTRTNHGIGWLLHLEFFFPKTLLEPWYHDLLESCDVMIDVGKTPLYIRVAVISQLALLLANRLKFLVLDTLETVVRGITRIAQ